MYQLTNIIWKPGFEYLIFTYSASGKSTFMKKGFTIVLISSLLVLLFGYTAFSKIFFLASFRGLLERLPFIGNGAGVLAFAIPLAELGIVLLLLVTRTRLYGLAASIGLLFLFTIYLGLMIAFAPHLPCSCGGIISSLGWREHVLLNAGLLASCVLAIRVRKRILM